MDADLVSITDQAEMDFVLSISYEHITITQASDNWEVVFLRLWTFFRVRKLEFPVAVKCLGETSI